MVKQVLIFNLFEIFHPYYRGYQSPSCGDYDIFKNEWKQFFSLCQFSLQHLAGQFYTVIQSPMHDLQSI